MFDQRFRLATSVQYGGVVAVPEVPANLFEALAGQLPSQQHGDTAGADDALLASGSLQVGVSQMEVLADESRDRPEWSLGDFVVRGEEFTKQSGIQGAPLLLAGLRQLQH